MNHPVDAAAAPKSWPSNIRIAAFCLWSCLGMSGCAQFWDDATAHDPRGNGFADDMRYRWRLLTDRRPPHVVLAEERDNDVRARAIRKLKPPLQDGGTPEQQAKTIALLSEASQSPKEPLTCRLAAVEKLGEFQDSAVVGHLRDAFLAPVNNTPRNPIVRIAIIDTMAKRKEPAASEMLVRALKFDPQSEEAKLDSSHADVRIASARGLANFPQPEVANALYTVLTEEKTKPVAQRNVALRQQANDSLKTITGKTFGPDPEEWHAYLSQGFQPVARRNDSFVEQVGHWFKR